MVTLPSQILYDVVKDTNNPYWLWLLQIKKLLRFTRMTKISDQQVSIGYLNNHIFLRKIDQRKNELQKSDSLITSLVNEGVF